MSDPPPCKSGNHGSLKSSFWQPLLCQDLLGVLFLSKQPTSGCNVWDAHMGFVIFMTATAVLFYCYYSFPSMWPSANNNMHTWCCRTWIQMQQSGLPGRPYFTQPKSMFSLEQLKAEIHKKQCRTWIQMQQTRHWSLPLQLSMLTCTSSSRQPVEEAAQPHRCPSSCVTHLPGCMLPWPPQESASWRSASSGNRLWSCCNSC